MKLQGMQFTALIAIGCCIGQVAAQQVVQVLHNVHVVGKIAHGGTASGSDGKEHLLVGVKLATPLEGGIDRVEAVVTHNEPSEKIRMSIGLYSGGVKNAGSVDLNCPSVKILATSAHKMALGEDCTFNRYDGPIAPE
jgi:hypothetical protein